jgi:hypothetical protein
VAARTEVTTKAATRPSSSRPTTGVHNSGTASTGERR